MNGKPAQAMATAAPAGPIDPERLAFDVDGVVADTMAVFVDLAQERYGLDYLRKEHLTRYDLYQCVQAERTVIDDLLRLLLDEHHTRKIPSMPGAAGVLTELSQYGTLRFVTARICPESIEKWLHRTLPQVSPGHIELIATGAPEAKLDVLRRRSIRHFVEDRAETCHLLADAGIQPVLFDQPWNQGVDSFPRVKTWAELRRMLLPAGGNTL